LFNRLFEHYCHSLVKAIQKFRSFKPIQSQINPTITLDGDCYELYSKYDDEGYLTGEAVLTDDLTEVSEKDFKMVNII